MNILGAVLGTMAGSSLMYIYKQYFCRKDHYYEAKFFYDDRNKDTEADLHERAETIDFMAILSFMKKHNL